MSSAAVSQEFAAQDVLHVYVESSITQFYRTTLDGASGMPNTYFPREGRVNFPLPRETKTVQIVLGEVPGSMPSLTVRVCLERGLVVNRCAEGAALGRLINVAPNAGAPPSLVFDQLSLDRLRPPGDVPFLLVRCVFFIVATGFFLAFFHSLLRPALAWWSPDAALVFPGRGLRAHSVLPVF